MVYYTEESDSIDMTSKAAVADERAKGKKRDVISLFQSKSALKSKAGKLSAKQEESDIKSTGARNDYLLSLETANAHQDRLLWSPNGSSHHNFLMRDVNKPHSGTSTMSCSAL